MRIDISCTAPDRNESLRGDRLDRRAALSLVELGSFGGK